MWSWETLFLYTFLQYLLSEADFQAKQIFYLSSHPYIIVAQVHKTWLEETIWIKESSSQKDRPPTAAAWLWKDLLNQQSPGALKSFPVLKT